jgi:hypothetical protein
VGVAELWPMPQRLERAQPRRSSVLEH